MLIISLRPLVWSLIPLSSEISFCCHHNTESQGGKCQRETLGARRDYSLWECGDPSIVVLGCPLGPIWDFDSDRDLFFFEEVAYGLGSAKGFGEQLLLQPGTLVALPIPMYSSNTGVLMALKAAVSLIGFGIPGQFICSL